MHFRRLTELLLALTLILVLGFALMKTAHSAPPSSHGILVVANQKEHTALLIDPDTHKELAKISVGINGHEVTVDQRKQIRLRPHLRRFWRRQARLRRQHHRRHRHRRAQTRPIRSTSANRCVPTTRTLAPTASFTSPPSFRNQSTPSIPAPARSSPKIPPAKTNRTCSSSAPGPITSPLLHANVHAGTVSVVDLEQHKLIKTIPVSKIVQRISIQPDGLYVFTHDQENPRIVVIDPLSNNISTSIDLPETVYSSAPTPDGHYLVAGGMHGHIFVIDLHTRKLFKTFDAPTALAKTLVRPDGNVAYISFHRWQNHRSRPEKLEAPALHRPDPRRGRHGLGRLQLARFSASGWKTFNELSTILWCDVAKRKRAARISN